MKDVLAQRAHSLPLVALLWTAPELLRLPSAPSSGTKEGDVYSFSIILQEILVLDKPFSTFIHKEAKGKHPAMLLGTLPEFLALCVSCVSCT